MADPQRGIESGGFSGGFQFALCGPMLPINAGAALATRSGPRLPNVAKYGGIVLQRLARPIYTNWPEQAVLHRVPFRSASWVVGNGDVQAELVSEGLQTLLPGGCAGGIGTTGVSQNQQPLGLLILLTAHVHPPRPNRVGGELSCVVRRSHDDKSISTTIIVDAVRDGDSLCVAGEVIDGHVDSILSPSAASIAEKSNQLALLRVDTDDRVSTLFEVPPQPVDVPELPVPLGMGLAVEALSVESKPVLFLPKHPPCFRGADTQEAGNHTRGLSRPFYRTHWIASSRPIQQRVHARGQFGSFFSRGLRPPPGRRTRPSGTVSFPRSSRWPSMMVVRLMPVTRDSRETPPCPSFSASKPTMRRACFSSRPASARRTRRCSIASPLRGCSVHNGQSQSRSVRFDIPLADHAGGHASTAQVIEGQPLSVALRDREMRDGHTSCAAQVAAPGAAGEEFSWVGATSSVPRMKHAALEPRVPRWGSKSRQLISAGVAALRSGGP